MATGNSLNNSKNLKNLKAYSVIIFKNALLKE